MSREESPAPVLAAGGLVIRPRKREGRQPGIEVLLVHRPDYDDWSFPKGKLDPDESPKQAARREVREETGYRCKVAGKVGRVEYATGNGRPKQVTYYEMTVDRGSFTPNDEVDEVRWATPKKARKLLTWQRDVDLLERWLADRRSRTDA